jgi:enoyl-CoA hydratase
MAFTTLLTEIKNNIYIATINRPDKMNALNIHLIAELEMAIDEATLNENVKGFILTGSGSKAFAAGADIAEFASFSREQALQLSANGHRIFNKIEECPKPVIAAVNGFALGGGCELAMACHMRVASDNAKFGQPEVNLGVIPGYGGTQRLVRYVGKAKALELLLTADMIDAATALQLGLVNYVVQQTELLDKCMEILNKIATKSLLVTEQIINCVNAYYDKKEDGFAREIEEFANCFSTEDFKEGTRAFMEKRKAVFKGK